MSVLFWLVIILCAMAGVAVTLAGVVLWVHEEDIEAEFEEDEEDES